MQKKRFTKCYWSAIECLYGDKIVSEGQCSGSEIKPRGEPKKRIKPKCPKERYEQIVAVARIKKLGIRVHHSPNGGRRYGFDGEIFKKMGVSAGWPDLTIPYARKGYHGLLIEVKRVFGGSLSIEQKEWGQHFIKEGYAWYEARGADEVMRIVYDYFEITI